MAHLSQRELVYLLAHQDPSLNKRGLQKICDAIEAGVNIDLNRDRALFTYVSALKTSPDQKVRLWLYKLIGLTNTTAFASYLSAQIEKNESHAENITWAYGALSRLIGIIAASKVLERGGGDPNLPAFIIASEYFRHKRPITQPTLSQAMGNDDPLSHLWISMRHGQEPRTVPIEVIRDLSSSEDTLVVEYSLWAAHRDTMAGLLHVSLDPQQFDTFPPNIRRWYLRLLLKDSDNVLPYWDIVEGAAHDCDSQVREALALGLAENRLNKESAGLLTEWYERESDPITKLSLRKLVLANKRNPLLRHVVTHANQATSADYGDARNQPAKILVPSGRTLRKENYVDAVPTIASDTSEEAYILGVDTVEFSRRTDRQQYTIFRDLLDGLHHQEEVKRQKPSDVSVLLTGDGFFVCFRGVQNRLSPVKLGLSLRNDFKTLRNYGLRFGINAGPATWIVMKNDTAQLISHAVNWTARVMSAADDWQILMSDSYYRTYVRPAADELYGAEFRSVPSRKTKHGEAIELWEAVSAGSV